ncbi:MAG: hypothetical protein DRP56_08085 [Planctomycetota bacterium]|nr:MAG: hypothetical protein DRP56_08085 [Planctomycetota bacterium]
MKKNAILIMSVLYVMVSIATAKVVYFNDFEQGDTSLSNFVFGHVTSVSSPYDINANSGELSITTELPNPTGAYAAIHTSHFASPYSAVLSDNPGLVTWSFNVSNQDGAYNNSFSFALASSAPDARTHTSSSYVFEGGGMVGNRMTLFRQIGPEHGEPEYEPIIDITDGLGVLPEIGSIKITFDPITHVWKLFGVISNEKTDPMSVDLLLGSTVDDTLTNIPLSYLSMSGRTTGSAYFDNLTVDVTPEPIAYRPVLIALSQEDETGLLLKGNPTLTVITEDTDTRTDLFNIYSSAQDALLVQGNARITASKLNIAGGMNIKGNLSYPDDMVISENLGDIGGLPPSLFEHYEPDYTGLSDMCPVDLATGKRLPVVVSGGEWVLEPGYYSAGVIIEDATVSCLPGIYHLGGGAKANSGLILKGSAVVDANEVMFHLVEMGQVSISSDAKLKITEPAGDDDGGFVFFQSSQNTSEAVFKGIADCSGVLYFPVNHVEVKGTVLCSILMADTIELSGSAELTVNPNYPPSE